MKFSKTENKTYDDGDYRIDGNDRNNMNDGNDDPKVKAVVKSWSATSLSVSAPLHFSPPPRILLITMMLVVRMVMIEEPNIYFLCLIETGGVGIAFLPMWDN